MKGKVWDTILKVIIAVASAVLGALGGSSMNLQNAPPCRRQLYLQGGDKLIGNLFVAKRVFLISLIMNSLYTHSKRKEIRILLFILLLICFPLLDIHGQQAHEISLDAHCAYFSGSIFYGEKSVISCRLLYGSSQHYHSVV